jgi:hypothetical protein
MQFLVDTVQFKRGAVTTADNVCETAVGKKARIPCDLFAELGRWGPIVRRAIEKIGCRLIGIALICGAVILENVDRKLTHRFRDGLYAAVKRRARHRHARRNHDASAARLCAEQIEQPRLGSRKRLPFEAEKLFEFGSEKQRNRTLGFAVAEVRQTVSYCSLSCGEFGGSRSAQMVSVCANILPDKERDPQEKKLPEGVTLGEAMLGNNFT